MVFALVDPMIKEKIISAYLAGHGRNEITRQLHAQGIKVSHGSVSNIINAYKRQHEQKSQPLPSQQTSSNTAINTSTTSNTTFFTAHTIGDGQTVPSNSILANWPVSFNIVNTDVISTDIGGPL